MIRAQLLIEVQSALEKGEYLQAGDFTLEALPRKDGSGALEIRYRFAGQYFFQVEVPNTVVERPTYGDPKVKITGVVAPGTLTEREKVSFSTKTELLAAISSWSVRIRDELLAVPQNRRFAEQQAQLEDLIKQVGELSDEYFTREEADRLSDRLDELEAQLRANIESSATSQRESNAKINALHAEIAMLKQSAEVLNKKGWAGTLLVRIKKWAANPENRELLKSGAAVARTLMLGDGSKK